MKLPQFSKIGFIGLGNMGSRMAKSLYNAGYPLLGNDIDHTKCKALETIGADATLDTTQVVKECDVIITSLRSSEVFIDVAYKYFLPNATDGKIFIDLGTTEVGKTRELAKSLSEKNSKFIDAPVSGGTHGAETGTLRIFVGGDKETVEACRPILEILGEPKFVVHCGPSGSGQIVKGVNQIAMGLGAAAYMEALAFGVCAGIEPSAIRNVVGSGEGWRGEFDKIAQRIINGNGKSLVVKFPELPYFLAEAEASDIELPLTEALYEFCKKSDYEMFDNMNRPSKSFWQELTKNSGKE